MTALEYMQKQLGKHKVSYTREVGRGAPAEQLKNIESKISYYEAAIEALKASDAQYARGKRDGLLALVSRLKKESEWFFMLEPFLKYLDNLVEELLGRE